MSNEQEIVKGSENIFEDFYPKEKAAWMQDLSLFMMHDDFSGLCEYYQAATLAAEARIRELCMEVAFHSVKFGAMHGSGINMNGLDSTDLEAIVNSVLEGKIMVARQNPSGELHEISTAWVKEYADGTIDSKASRLNFDVDDEELHGGLIKEYPMFSLEGVESRVKDGMDDMWYGVS